VGGAGEPHFTMGAEEASRLTELLAFQKVVPLHYEDWAHFSENRGDATAFFEARELAHKVRWLERGVATTVG
jgi:L-ascorbate metabolism protein UlaG (beta-lactamase superfamily)